MKTLFVCLVLACTISLPLDAQTTDREWQEEAVNRFPEIAVRDSPLNKMFVAEYNRLKQTTPDFFRNNPNWPVIIATQCSAQLSRPAVIPGLDDARIPPSSNKIVQPKPESTLDDLKDTARRQAELDRLFSGARPERPRTAAEAHAKLNAIIFPQIDFRDATLSECAEFITAKSKTLDPQGVGVSIMIAPSVPPSKTGVRLTLTLKNVPQIEVLKYIVTLPGGLQYRIDGAGITILPK